MVKRKRRKLKKKVKIILFLFAFFIITFGVIGYFIGKTYAFQDKEIIFEESDNENENEDIDNDLDASIENDIANQLNRVEYYDGFYYEDLSNEIKEKITGGSFPLEFDSDFMAISYEDLKYVKVKYYDFSGIEHTDGELIVNKLVAQDIVEIFYKLYLEKYPIASIKLVEEFNSIDELSMRANNTSAFCYRIVENIDRLSWHAYGLAIDINPLFNPYVVGDTIYPSTALDYVDRNLDFDGKIDHDDLAYKLFTEYGWKWGGNFKYSKDYQHFYKEVLDDSVRERGL